jgi:hypothetical protein
MPGRYTERMQMLLLLVIVGCMAGIGAALWRLGRTREQRRRESEARGARMLAAAAEYVRQRAQATRAPDTAGRD